jgi:glycine/sarcosine N-methyltransferase
MHERLAPGGTWLVSLRPYDALLRERPTVMPPVFYTDAGAFRRIVYQP